MYDDRIKWLLDNSAAETSKRQTQARKAKALKGQALKGPGSDICTMAALPAQRWLDP